MSNNILVAQNFKEVLGKPTLYERPLDDTEFITAKTNVKSKSTAWLVISDRSENQLFREPNGAPAGKVGFKEWFYVVDEKGDWLQLIKTSPTNLRGLKIINREGIEVAGWINKRKLLPWTSGLLHKTTKINIKGFLLNKAEEIETVINSDKTLVNVYQSPNRGDKVDSKRIYEFYFIYKKETLGDKTRYLLATDSELGTLSLETSLIGWVDKRRVTDWNTRISLEPNFTDEGFAERKGNSTFQLKGYKEFIPAIDHAQKGTITNTSVMWENDPVRISPSKLANSNNKRFLGQVVRFPMLSSGSGDNVSRQKDIFRSGVISDVLEVFNNKVVGEYKPGDDAVINEKVKQTMEAKDNYNVLFVIEGTESMEAYRKDIIDVIKGLPKQLHKVENIKVGVAIYRDIYERKDKRDFEILKMTKDQHEPTEFLENMVFSSVHDLDPYTNMYYGITQGIQKSGMSPDHTNIVYVIGMDADLSSSKLRRTEHEGDKALIRTKKVGEVLAKYGVHMNVIRCKHEGDSDKRGRAFLSASRSMMMESANKQYQEFKGIMDRSEHSEFKNLKNPYFPEIETDNELFLTNGTKMGKLYYPDGSGAIAKSELKKGVESFSVRVNDSREAFFEALRKVTIEGESLDNALGDAKSKVDEVSAGSFAPAFAQVLEDYYKAGAKASFEDDDVLDQILNENYRLYLEVYFPRKVVNAKHNTMSYVLFMPWKDLKDYIDILDKLALAYDKSPDVRREALLNTLVELLNHFSGEADDSKSLKKKSTRELMEMMQGIKGEGLEFQMEQDFKIGEIEDEKKVPDDAIATYIKRILKNSKKLREIASNSNYEFSYQSDSGQVYYWIPIEYTY